MDIRQARKAAKLTQEELAKMIGVNRATLSKYESGQIEPSLSQLRKIAHALNVPVTTLWGLPEALEDKFNFAIDAVEANENGTLTFIPYNEMIKLRQEIEEQYQANADSFTKSDEGRKVISAYYKMNYAGRKEAVKRVCELAELKKYRLFDSQDATEPHASAQPSTSTPNEEKPPEGHSGPKDGK